MLKYLVKKWQTLSTHRGRSKDTIDTKRRYVECSNICGYGEGKSARGS
jgi:hypothetical protein